MTQSITLASFLEGLQMTSSQESKPVCVPLAYCIQMRVTSGLHGVGDMYNCNFLKNKLYTIFIITIITFLKKEIY